jgi:hypothetical protein
VRGSFFFAPSRVRHRVEASGEPIDGLADVFQILSTGTKQSEVHLFAKWTPNKDLTEPLRADGIGVVAHPLSVNPSAVLEANRCYHMWDGTEQQGHEFRLAIWAPAWMVGAPRARGATRRVRRPGPTGFEKQ